MHGRKKTKKTTHKEQTTHCTENNNSVNTLFSLKSLSTLSQKSATFYRSKVRLSPNFAVVSPFSATVALFGDSVDRA